MLGRLGRCFLLAVLKCIVGTQMVAFSLGHSVRNVREWRLACMGMSDPCLGSDDVAGSPLQLVAQVRPSLGRSWFPALHTYYEGIRLAKTSHFRLALWPVGLRCGVDLEAPAVFHFPCVDGASGLLAHGSLLDLSDAEKLAGTRPPVSICPETKRSTLRANDDRCRFGRALASRLMRPSASMRNATWLILPVVICLSQRLSHACVSMN